MTSKPLPKPSPSLSATTATRDDVLVVLVHEPVAVVVDASQILVRAGMRRRSVVIAIRVVGHAPQRLIARADRRVRSPKVS
jgi:hypothetical protein